MDINVEIKNQNGYVYVWFFKFDFQPNVTADIIEVQKEYKEVQDKWNRAQNKSGVKDPKDVYVKNETFYLKQYENDQANVRNRFSYRTL